MRLYKWNTHSSGALIPSEQGHHAMSLHPQLLADAPLTSRSGIFRLKALFAEQRAKESSESRLRSDWEELAIEWHMMANLADGAKNDNSQTEFAKTAERTPIKRGV
jgi:hypothetical protein